MSNTPTSTILLADLVIGSTSKVSLVDLTGREVIAQGAVVTLALVESIRQEGVTRVCVAPSRDQPSPSVDPTPSVQSTSLAQCAYSPERIQRLGEKFGACEQIVDRLIERLESGEPVFSREVESQVDEYVEELAADPDPVIAGVLQHQRDLTLSRRCVQFSVLSMAIGMSQKLQPLEIRDLGIAAMMHDASLFLLAPAVRFPHLPMSEVQRQDYLRHPITSELLLEKVRGITPVQRRLVSQVHEFLDGSGFPRGLSAAELHPLSRVLSTAEGYLTLTSPPTGHPRIMPCDAIAYLIASASKGRYAPGSVSALLRAVTLYPLGSVLELSDTTQVKVIRSNGNDYGYPIVQSIADPDCVIDLRYSELFITRPVPARDHDEARLPDAYKELNSSLQQ